MKVTETAMNVWRWAELFTELKAIPLLASYLPQVDIEVTENIWDVDHV